MDKNKTLRRARTWLLEPYALGTVRLLVITLSPVNHDTPSILLHQFLRPAYFYLSPFACLAPMSPLRT